MSAVLLYAGGGKERAMGAKKWKKSAIWRMLFSFLVVSKVLYYSNLVATALNQGGLRAMGEAVLTRLLTQDILIILVILLTFNTEKFIPLKISRYNKALNQTIVHIIDYVLYMGVLALYFGIMLFFNLFQNVNWYVFLIYSSSVYLAIVIVLEIKKYLKKKEVTAYAHDLSTDEKLAMLKTLLDNGVLTQEEYDCKKGRLL